MLLNSDTVCYSDYTSLSDYLVKCVLGILRSVFGPNEHYENILTWKNHSPEILLKLESPGLLNKPVAFVAITQRNHCGTIYPHIWLCGTLPEYQGKGYFSELISVYSLLHPSATFMTVCTYPDQFPIMYEWIRKRSETALHEELGGGKILAKIRTS
jgi:hypothetical protein